MSQLDSSVLSKNSRSRNKEQRRYHKKQPIPAQFRRISKAEKEVITYILDTNVIMDNWKQLFKFDEHTVCITRDVWRELDGGKKIPGDAGWNSRMAIAFCDSVMAKHTSEELMAGVPLKPPKSVSNGRKHTGKIMFDFSKPEVPDRCNTYLMEERADDRIIMHGLTLGISGKKVVFISGDGNARGVATMAGLENEPPLGGAVAEAEYEENRLTGYHALPNDIWDKLLEEPMIERVGEETRYTLKAHAFKKMNPNEFIVTRHWDNGVESELELVIKRKPKGNVIVAETFPNYRAKNPVNIQAKDPAQSFTIHTMLTRSVEGMSISGKAGSGKTYIALACGLHMVQDLHWYDQAIYTMSADAAFRKLGFLPGDLQDKLFPVMGPAKDNLKKLLGDTGRTETEKAMTKDFMAQYISFEALELMKGRSLHRTLLIVDEAEDLSEKDLYILSTRLAEGSKLVLLGNVKQMEDNSGVNEFNNALSLFINRFADCEETAHITLHNMVRTKFAALAEERLSP